MKKWLISLITLTLSLATVGVVAGFTLTSGGDDVPERTYPPIELSDGDPIDFGDGIGDGKVLTSADDIDPNECNLVHNINACSPEELEAGYNLGTNQALVDDAPAPSAACAIGFPDCNDTPVEVERGEIEPYFGDAVPELEPRIDGS